jgi:hypothetical protein
MHELRKIRGIVMERDQWRFTYLVDPGCIEEVDTKVQRSGNRLE